MIALRAAYSPALVRVGEVCSFTGEIVYDRKRREWQIFSCGSQFRAQQGIDRSPLGTLAEAKAWASEQGVIALDAGETKAVVLGMGILLGVAFLFGIYRYFAG